MTQVPAQMRDGVPVKIPPKDGTREDTSVHRTSDTLEDLFESFRANEDPVAARKIFHVLFRPLVSHAIKMGLPPDRAEDAAQEALMRLFHKKDSFEQGRQLFSWAVGICTHATLDQFRKMHRVRKHEREASTLRSKREGAHGPLGLLDRFNASNELEPPKAAILKEQEQAVRRALDTMRARYEEKDPKKAYFAKHFPELPKHREMAEAFGVPLGTVKSSLVSFRKEIREFLEENFSDFQSGAA